MLESGWMTFSGGSYEEVARWLWNFLTSHAKRVDPRVEVRLESGSEREGRSYGAELRLGDRRSTLWEFDYKEVADNRGRLVWCSQVAEQARARARELMPEAGGAGPAAP
jgi:hypothetical protein